MTTEFFIPQLGQTVEEVTIVKWLVPDGTRVSHGQEIVEVETDKAVFPVEANAKGYLHIGPFKEGEVVPVLTVVALIGSQDEQFSSGNPAAEAELPPSTQTTPAVADTVTPEVGTADFEKSFVSPRARKLADARGVNLSQVKPTGGGGVRVAERDVLAFLSSESQTRPAPRPTPVAQKVAAAAGLDLSAVAGSGPGGRIVRGDVERALEPAATPTPASKPVPIEAGADVLERIPLKGVRAIIADRMGTSVHTTARVTLLMDVDATQFVEARGRLKARVEKDWGFAPGYNDLLAKIVAQALRKYPYMNARLTADAIERVAQINLGMAVDTERGLLVPVIRDADRISLREFGDDFRKKVERARIGRSLPDDLSGGTFTITNLGMYDVDGFTPVINLPEAAILGVGRIAPKPVVIEGDIVAVRQMLTLSLVFDHRLIDGAPAARFLQSIKQVIEEPYLLLAS